MPDIGITDVMGKTALCECCYTEAERAAGEPEPDTTLPLLVASPRMLIAMSRAAVRDLLAPGITGRRYLLEALDALGEADRALVAAANE